MPFTEADDALIAREPGASTAHLRRVAGVKPRRAVDVVRALRESRDQR